MIGRVAIAVLLASSTLGVSAADLCPSTKAALEWSTQCFEGEGDFRRVKPKFINRIAANRYGMATILIGAPRELVAVDRHGKIVVPDIRHTGDFDYPNAHLGIGRFSVVEKDSSGKRAEKCGYFQAGRFQIVVHARFDHCQPFREQQAIACKACASYCTEIDCQNRILLGGKGFVLGRDGNIRRTFALPTVETVCNRPDLARVSELSSGATLVRCINAPGTPFNEM